MGGIKSKNKDVSSNLISTFIRLLETDPCHYWVLYKDYIISFLIFLSGKIGCEIENRGGNRADLCWQELLYASLFCFVFKPS